MTKGLHRLAIMEKSRYDTEKSIYSINQDLVIKNAKVTLSWKEIEGEWFDTTYTI